MKLYMLDDEVSRNRGCSFSGTFCQKRSVIARSICDTFQQLQRYNFLSDCFRTEADIRQLRDDNCIGICCLNKHLCIDYNMQKLSSYRDEYCKHYQEVIEELLLLQEFYREEHLFSLQQAVELYDNQEKLQDSDRQIKKYFMVNPLSWKQDAR